MTSPKTVESCKNPSSNCFTFVLHDSVLRGCTVNEPPASAGKYADKLITCSDHSNCNDLAIEAEHCYSLELSELESNTLDLLPDNSKRCAYDVKRAGCYHAHNKSSNIVKKGCMSDLSPHQIKELKKDSEFLWCMGDNCNSEVKPLSCLACQSNIYSKNTAHCLSDLSSVQKKSCSQYNDKCYTHVSQWNVKRGCLSEASENIHSDCMSKTGQCELCDSPDGCNEDKYEYEVCYAIQYNRNTSIDLSPKYSKRCNLKAIHEGCYHFEDQATGMIEKGCVADLSENERSKYAGMPENYFKTCTDKLCNDRQSFLSCFTCSSNDASDYCVTNMHDVPLQMCGSYNDQCFIRSTDGVNYERGCLSHASDQVKSDCTTSNRYCSLCIDQSGCNNHLKQTEHCYAVAYSGNQTITLLSKQSKSCEFSAAPMGCYHFHNFASGIVEKGCISDLPEDEMMEYSQYRRFFRTCVGTNCNNKAEFLSCVTCNTSISSDTASCISDMAGVKVELCAHYDDQCFTYVDSSTVRRGCSSNAPQPVLDVCRNSDSSQCKMCDANSKCNNDELHFEYCHESPSDLRKCQLSVEHQGCYHYDNPTDPVISRGCGSELDRSMISTNILPHYKFCFGEGCNSKTTFLSCLKCETTDGNTDCALARHNVTRKVCENYDDKCYTRSVDGVSFERGCMADAQENIFHACSSNDRHCLSCDEAANCNNQITTKEHCYSTNFLKTATKECSSTLIPMGCYHYEDAETRQTDKGCISDLSAQQIAIYSERKPYFQTCSGDKCNSKEKMSTCLTCTSNDSNGTCLNDLENVEHRPCNEDNTGCYTRINENNKLERGCLSSLNQNASSDCSSGKKCAVCTYGADCNNRVKEIEQCHSFHGFKGWNRTAFMEDKVIACPLSWERKGCFHFVYSTGLVSKGCISDLKEYLLTWMVSHRSAFKACHGNACNSGESFQSCITCSSNHESEVCDSLFRGTQLKVCNDYEDKCYTRMTMRTVERGCLGEASNDVVNVCLGKTNGNCETCNGAHPCNDQKKYFDHCYSGVYKKNEPTDDLPRKKCFSIADLSGCYIHEDLENGNIDKGCVTDLSESKLLAYKDQPKQFRVCNGKHCNSGHTIESIPIDTNNNNIDSDNNDKNNNNHDSNNSGHGDSAPKENSLDNGMTPGTTVPNPEDAETVVEETPESEPDTTGPNGQTDDPDNTSTIIIVCVSIAVVVILGVGVFFLRRKTGFWRNRTNT